MFAIGQLSRNKHQKSIKKIQQKTTVKKQTIETYEQAMSRMQKEYESYLNSLDERDLHEWSQFYN